MYEESWSGGWGVLGVGEYGESGVGEVMLRRRNCALGMNTIDIIYLFPMGISCWVWERVLSISIMSKMLENFLLLRIFF
jgi:hypothetical protein